MSGSSIATSVLRNEANLCDLIQRHYVVTTQIEEGPAPNTKDPPFNCLKLKLRNLVTTSGPIL